MDKYHLTKDDWDAFLELGLGELQGDALLKKIPASVKSNFTRQYNKGDHHLPYAIGAMSSKARGKGNSESKMSVDFEEAIQNDDVEEDGGEDEKEDAVDDKMIKAKKPSAATKKAAASTSKKATVPKKTKK